MITGGRARSKDGTEIAYLAMGSGPTVLCLHGTFSTGVDWLPVATLLADSYRLVLMDRRGHGASSSGISGHDLELEHQDVEAVLAEQPDPQAALLGHSFGGCIGLTMAVSGGDSPFRRIVAIEPPFLNDVTAEQLDEFHERMAAGSYEETVVWGFAVVQGVPERTLDRMRRSVRGWGELVSAAPMMGRHWEMTRSFPDISVFATLDVPTLLLHGSRSDEFPFKTSCRALAGTIPGAALAVLDGHDHLSMVRDPEPVAAKIRSFLEE